MSELEFISGLGIDSEQDGTHARCNSRRPSKAGFARHPLTVRHMTLNRLAIVNDAGDPIAYTPCDCEECLRNALFMRFAPELLTLLDVCITGTLAQVQALAIAIDGILDDELAQSFTHEQKRYMRCKN